jgi:IS605 OrfB family transposase
VHLRYNYRLYPSPGQRSALARAFGCARVVFNDGLRARQEAHAAGLPYITDSELSARLTAAKATSERAWLGEVPAVVLQQALADKARVKVARAHARVADARREFHHQLSTALIRENQAVAVEGLAVSGLARTRMAKSVHDAGWSAFVHMLEYKARRYGREFHRIGRFIPTSQTCSACGIKDGPKPLHVRAWQCRECGAWLDRDVNAAVNVAKAAGLAVTACGAQVRPGPALAQRGEAGTHPKPRREAA